MNQKKLTLSDNKMIMGVLGGLADYTGYDATLIRLIAAISIALTGLFPGVLFYGLAAIIMPKKGK